MSPLLTVKENMYDLQSYVGKKLKIKKIVYGNNFFCKLELIREEACQVNEIFFHINSRHK